MSRFGTACHRVTHRIGWRGDVLITLAVLDVCYGWTLITASPSVLDSNTTFRWMDSVFPLAAFGAIWWAVALICTVAAFQRDDRFGWGAAAGIKVLWGLLCLAGWAFDTVSLGSVAIWLCYARIVWRVSGWTERDHDSEDAL